MKKIKYSFCIYFLFLYTLSLHSVENSQPLMSPYQLYFIITAYSKMCLEIIFYSDNYKKIENSKIYCNSCKYPCNSATLWAYLTVTADKSAYSEFMDKVDYGLQEDLDFFLVNWYEKNQMKCSHCSAYQGWSLPNC